jgi:D-lactate dehydrogenase
MKVAIFSTHSYDRDFFEKFNKSEKTQLTYFETSLNRDTANLSRDFEAVCIFVNDKIDAKTAHILSKNGVKLIVLRCAGFNNIDLEAAEKYHLKILRVPAYSPNAIAEHAVALILTLNRKTHKAYNRIRENNFSLDNLTGFNLAGKTVGVIGTGRIGMTFCKIMSGFGCKVIAFDTIKSDEVIEMGSEYKTLNEIWEYSDIISLHCPLTPETHHLINENTFEKMKHGVMLINTSRGAVINTKDAINALKNGKLGYLGIDVYEQEEHLFFRDLSESIVQDDTIIRLMSFPNVLITAHQGFFTNEALEQITTITLKNIEDFEKGNFLENEVKFS